ncbi:MAG: hypothetical protein GX153_12595 [Clostridiaceae bacterium]|nr:hypothetical protein [Clostridiaceae bacterium]
MKESPKQRDLRSSLEPGTLSGEGFLGTDKRSPAEIIQKDQETVESLGLTHAVIARRMRDLTEAGKAGLGRPVVVDGALEVTVEDARGAIACPFKDRAFTAKQVTEVVHTKTGQSLRWSDLNIHLIEAHGFYEGEGAPFRIDPATLIRLIEVPSKDRPQET